MLSLSFADATQMGASRIFVVLPVRSGDAIQSVFALARSNVDGGLRERALCTCWLV